MTSSKRVQIYDIIPTIEKRLFKLLEDFLNADNRKFHLWEMAVFVPACNAFIHNMSGLNEALRTDNYISAITNLRSAIESLSVVVFDGTAHLTEKEYNKFLKKGRFYRYEYKDAQWQEVGVRSMVTYAEKALGIKLVKNYDECCNMVHFSASHMGFLGRFTNEDDQSKKQTRILIGSKDKIPPSSQKELIDSTVQLATQLGKCIVAATKEKQERHGKT